MKRDPLKCGACGCDTFTLVHVAPDGECRFGGSNTPQGCIQAICTKCEARSEIGVQATLTIDVEGTLCGGWRS